MLKDPNTGLSAYFPFATCNNNHYILSIIVTEKIYKEILTSRLFHHLDEISCEDQTYILHILVQWQPTCKTNDTHTCNTHISQFVNVVIWCLTILVKVIKLYYSFEFYLGLICTSEFFKKQNLNKLFRQVQFQLLKNSQVRNVQINSKWNSKP